MSFSKGIRSASSRRKPSSSPSSSHDKKRPSEQSSSSERKMRSLQSLQERLCFTLKRPRTRRHRNSHVPNNSPYKGGGYGGLKLQLAHPQAKSTLMESGLIQIPHLQCEYYESPSPLSMNSSCFSQESVATTTSTTTATTASSSNITYVSPISALEYNSSDDAFSCDEVMSLVSCCCPDMGMHNVLDFMPHPSPPHRLDMCEERCSAAGRSAAAVGGKCESKAADLGQGKVEYSPSPSSVDDDGEPYRIDLCDFEPDVNALNSPPHHQKHYGGGVLCLRLDYEEVLRAWKERGECLISREPMYYPAPYLDPLHIFGYVPFVSHPQFF